MLERTVPFNEIRTIEVGKLSLRVAQSAIELAQDATTLAGNYLQSLLQRQETVSIILATGNSQLGFLKEIASNSQLDWNRIILFHLDEYLGISADSPGSFRYYLHQQVEQRVTPRIFNFIQGDALQPLAECDRYSHLLQQQPIDFCMLGIGNNGHLAFNEPTVADFNDAQKIKLVRLETTTRQQQVDGGYFASLDAVPNYAYTLTIPTICAAKKIFCLATGSHKAEIIKQTLTQEIAPSFPATILRTLPQATLFCDRDAFDLVEKII